MLISFQLNNLNCIKRTYYKIINKFMPEKYNVYLISDSTGETLDRIFLSLKSQFSNFDYEKKEFVFIRTENQINKVIKECEKKENVIILYTVVETKLAKYLSQICEKKKNPLFWNFRKSNTKFF